MKGMRRVGRGTVLRRLVLGGLAVVACSGGLASATPQHAPAPVSCGPGTERVVVGGPTVDQLCVHTAADTYAALGVRGPSASGATAAVRPTCYGDGETGPRIQLVYGYAQGYPNRARVAVPQIRDVVAPRMEAMIRAGAEGKDLGLRFQMAPGCRTVDVKVVAFPRAAQETADLGVAVQQYAAISKHLDSSGLNRDDRKYLVFWDGWTTQGTCGIATTMMGPSPVSDSPQQVNPHEGTPTAGAYTDVPSTAGVGGLAPKYAMVWGQVLRRGGPSCWGAGKGERPTTPVHELFHLLGAVQASAPHSDGAGHCVEVPSVMCYGEKTFYVPECDNRTMPVLDCGNDDYWDPDPAPGSYLDTHANVARSRFFGPQPQDALAGLALRGPGSDR